MTDLQPTRRRRPRRSDARQVAIRSRDAALRRLIRARTVAIGGAAALTAAFAGLVADVAPGRGSAHRSDAPAAAALPRLATPTQLGLRAARPPRASHTGTTGTTTAAATSTAPAGTTAAPSPTVPAPQPAPPPAPVTSGGS